MALTTRSHSRSTKERKVCRSKEQFHWVGCLLLWKLRVRSTSQRGPIRHYVWCKHPCRHPGRLSSTEERTYNKYTTFTNARPSPLAEAFQTLLVHWHIFLEVTETLVQCLATVVYQAYIAVLQLSALFKLHLEFSSKHVSFSTSLRCSLRNVRRFGYLYSLYLYHRGTFTWSAKV